MNGSAISRKIRVKNIKIEKMLMIFMNGNYENNASMSEMRKYVKCSEFPSNKMIMSKLFSRNSDKMDGK